jgi:hypothetical protein
MLGGMQGQVNESRGVGDISRAFGFVILAGARERSGQREQVFVLGKPAKNGV